MSMLWIVIYVALFYFMFRYGGCCGGHGSHGRHRGHGAEGDLGGHGPGGNVLSASNDPVCGMAVSEGDGYSRVYRGREYRLCSKTCLDRFDNDADRYTVEERRAS